MQEIFFDIAEKPNWERMEAVMQKFNEEEQQTIYNWIRGAAVVKSFEKEREDHDSAIKKKPPLVR